MCVLFWSDKDQVTIPYVAEFLNYNLLKRRVLITLVVAISNKGKESVTVGALHRRDVHVEKSMSRWYKYVSGRGDNDIKTLADLYGESLTISEDYDLKLNDPLDPQKQIGVFKFVSEEATLEKVGPLYPSDDFSNKDSRITNIGVEWTPFRFGPIEGGGDWLFSFQIKIDGSAYEALMGDEEYPCVIIDGASEIKRRMMCDDLYNQGIESPWLRYFEETVFPNIVKPARYDIIITNRTGMLPICYRLSSRVRRQYIADDDFAKSVAWFSSDDPDQDFSIELEFQESKALA